MPLLLTQLHSYSADLRRFHSTFSPSTNAIGNHQAKTCWLEGIPSHQRKTLYHGRNTLSTFFFDLFFRPFQSGCFRGPTAVSGDLARPRSVSPTLVIHHTRADIQIFLHQSPERKMGLYLSHVEGFVRQGFGDGVTGPSTALQS